MDLGVVVVHYADPEVLRTCLSSIEADLNHITCQIVVVDNSVCGLQQGEAGPQVELIRNTSNVGFARAVNQGARKIRAPLLLVINPDASLIPGCMARLLDALEADPVLGLVGPRVLNPDGTLQGSARRDPTLLTGILGRRSWLRRISPSFHLAQREVLDALAINTGKSVVRVDWVSGTCQFIRKRAFDQVVGFDERFFLYFEDADFCRRLRIAGWDIGYVPAAEVIHMEGRSSRHVPLLALRCFHESALIYYNTYGAPQKWHPMRPIARLILFARRHVLQLYHRWKGSRRAGSTGGR